MGMQIPDGLVNLFYGLTGTKWPDVDEDRLRDLSDMYETVQYILDTELPELVLLLRRKVSLTFDGRTTDYFERSLAQFTAGERDYLGEAGRLAEEIKEYAREAANQVEYAKWMIIGQLVQLALEIAWAIAMSYWTFGASLSWITLFTFVRQEMIRRILNWLVWNLLSHLFVAQLFGVTMDLLIQRIQRDEGNRDEWDRELTRMASAGAFVEGLLSAGLSFGADVFLSKRLSGALGDSVGDVSADAATPPPRSLDPDPTPDPTAPPRDPSPPRGSARDGAPAPADRPDDLDGPGDGDRPGDTDSTGAPGDGDVTPRFGRDLSHLFSRNSFAFLRPEQIPGGGWKAPGAAQRFRDDAARTFERDLGPVLGGNAARDLGRDYADTFLGNWDTPDLRPALDDLLSSVPLPRATRDHLAHDVPEALTRTLGEFGTTWWDRLLNLGVGAGSGALEGYLGEGFTNLLFSPEREWKASGMSAVAGATTSTVQQLATWGGVAAIDGLRDLRIAAPDTAPPATDSDSATRGADPPRSAEGPASSGESDPVREGDSEDSDTGTGDDVSGAPSDGVPGDSPADTDAPSLSRAPDTRLRSVPEGESDTTSDSGGIPSPARDGDATVDGETSPVEADARDLADLFQAELRTGVDSPATGDARTEPRDTPHPAVSALSRNVPDAHVPAADGGRSSADPSPEEVPLPSSRPGSSSSPGAPSVVGVGGMNAQESTAVSETSAPDAPGLSGVPAPVGFGSSTAPVPADPGATGATAGQNAADQRHDTPRRPPAATPASRNDSPEATHGGTTRTDPRDATQSPPQTTDAATPENTTPAAARTSTPQTSTDPGLRDGADPVDTTGSPTNTDAPPQPQDVSPLPPPPSGPAPPAPTGPAPPTPAQDPTVRLNYLITTGWIEAYGVRVDPDAVLSAVRPPLPDDVRDRFAEQLSQDVRPFFRPGGVPVQGQDGRAYRLNLAAEDDWRPSPTTVGGPARAGFKGLDDIQEQTGQSLSDSSGAVKRVGIQFTGHLLATGGMVPLPSFRGNLGIGSSSWQHSGETGQTRTRTTEMTGTGAEYSADLLVGLDAAGRDGVPAVVRRGVELTLMGGLAPRRSDLPDTIAFPDPLGPRPPRTPAPARIGGYLSNSHPLSAEEVPVTGGVPAGTRTTDQGIAEWIADRLGLSTPVRPARWNPLRRLYTPGEGAARSPWAERRRMRALDLVTGTFRPDSLARNLPVMTGEAVVLTFTDSEGRPTPVTVWSFPLRMTNVPDIPESFNLKHTDRFARGSTTAAHRSTGFTVRPGFGLMERLPGDAVRLEIPLLEYGYSRETAFHRARQSAAWESHLFHSTDTAVYRVRRRVAVWVDDDAAPTLFDVASVEAVTAHEARTLDDPSANAPLPGGPAPRDPFLNRPRLTHFGDSQVRDVTFPDGAEVRSDAENRLVTVFGEFAHRLLTRIDARYPGLVLPPMALPGAARPGRSHAGWNHRRNRDTAVGNTVKVLSAVNLQSFRFQHGDWTGQGLEIKLTETKLLPGGNEAGEFRITVPDHISLWVTADVGAPVPGPQLKDSHTGSTSGASAGLRHRDATWRSHQVELRAAATWRGVDVVDSGDVPLFSGGGGARLTGERRSVNQRGSGRSVTAEDNVKDKGGTQLYFAEVEFGAWIGPGDNLVPRSARIDRPPPLTSRGLFTDGRDRVRGRIELHAPRPGRAIPLDPPPARPPGSFRRLPAAQARDLFRDGAPATLTTTRTGGDAPPVSRTRAAEILSNTFHVVQVFDPAVTRGGDLPTSVLTRGFDELNRMLRRFPDKLESASGIGQILGNHMSPQQLAATPALASGHGSRLRFQTDNKLPPTRNRTTVATWFLTTRVESLAPRPSASVEASHTKESQIGTARVTTRGLFFGVFGRGGLNTNRGGAPGGPPPPTAMDPIIGPGLEARYQFLGRGDTASTSRILRSRTEVKLRGPSFEFVADGVVAQAFEVKHDFSLGLTIPRTPGESDHAAWTAPIAQAQKGVVPALWAYMDGLVRDRVDWAPDGALTVGPHPPPAAPRAAVRPMDGFADKGYQSRPLDPGAALDDLVAQLSAGGYELTGTSREDLIHQLSTHMARDLDHVPPTRVRVRSKGFSHGATLNLEVGRGASRTRQFGGMMEFVERVVVVRSADRGTLETSGWSVSGLIEARGPIEGGTGSVAALQSGGDVVVRRQAGQENSGSDSVSVERTYERVGFGPYGVVSTDTTLTLTVEVGGRVFTGTGPSGTVETIQPVSYLTVDGDAPGTEPDDAGIADLSRRARDHRAEVTKLLEEARRARANLDWLERDAQHLRENAIPRVQANRDAAEQTRDRLRNRIRRAEEEITEVERAARTQADRAVRFRHRQDREQAVADAAEARRNQAAERVRAITAARDAAREDEDEDSGAEERIRALGDRASRWQDAADRADGARWDARRSAAMIGMYADAARGHLDAAAEQAESLRNGIRDLETRLGRAEDDATRARRRLDGLNKQFRSTLAGIDANRTTVRDARFEAADHQRRADRLDQQVRDARLARTRPADDGPGTAPAAGDTGPAPAGRADGPTTAPGTVADGAPATDAVTAWTARQARLGYVSLRSGGGTDAPVAVQGGGRSVFDAAIESAARDKGWRPRDGGGSAHEYLDANAGGRTGINPISSVAGELVLRGLAPEALRRADGVELSDVNGTTVGLKALVDPTRAAIVSASGDSRARGSEHGQHGVSAAQTESSANALEVAGQVLTDARPQDRLRTSPAGVDLAGNARSGQGRSSSSRTGAVAEGPGTARQFLVRVPAVWLAWSAPAGSPADQRHPVQAEASVTLWISETRAREWNLRTDTPEIDGLLKAEEAFAEADAAYMAARLPLLELVGTRDGAGDGFRDRYRAQVRLMERAAADRERALRGLERALAAARGRAWPPPPATAASGPPRGRSRQDQLIHDFTATLTPASGPAT
ncbi:hypothetical protein ACIBFB_00140 [Nocardiopsis sp. NPDC050513]|uniref:WXG100-like domain-containing protein n=1 Tax=Nocardiopsis sp. NPDC050513 TaxID=3364338 RepID=UPI00379535A2